MFSPLSNHQLALFLEVLNSTPWSRLYTCQLSRLRVENFDLMLAHACGPISHAWLKNVSCCRFAWHNFQNMLTQTHVLCKMNKWQYLPRDLWFWKWKALGVSSTSADFGRLRKTSDSFGRLRTSSGIFGNDHVVFKNPSTPRIKISRLYLRKSWQVYACKQATDVPAASCDS